MLNPSMLSLHDMSITGYRRGSKFIIRSDKMEINVDHEIHKTKV